MKLAMLCLLATLAGCTSARVGTSTALGTGTNINIGAAIDGSGIRPKGSITQKIF